MKFIFIVLLALISCALTGISFEAEELDFKLDTGSFELDGLYYFANYADTMVTKLIYFPVPFDSLCLKAALLKLEVVDDSLSSCSLYRQDEGGFSFTLSMPERSFCSLRIAYTQQLLGENARYILTTANGWGRPLPYARYSLQISDKVKLQKLPFPDPKFSQGKYIWEFENFRPAHEFELLFSAVK